LLQCTIGECRGLALREKIADFNHLYQSDVIARMARGQVRAALAG
jgi:hypothetical protein